MPTANVNAHAPWSMDNNQCASAQWSSASGQLTDIQQSRLLEVGTLARTQSTPYRHTSFHDEFRRVGRELRPLPNWCSTVSHELGNKQLTTTCRNRTAALQRLPYTSPWVAASSMLGIDASPSGLKASPACAKGGNGATWLRFRCRARSEAYPKKR